MKYDDYRDPKLRLARIFVRTIYKTMENQYCKVGAITPMNSNRQTIHLLEYQYQNFMDKASNINDAKLVEFFESKAKKVQRILENLV